MAFVEMTRNVTLIVAKGYRFHLSLCNPKWGDVVNFNDGRRELVCVSVCVSVCQRVDSEEEGNYGFGGQLEWRRRYDMDLWTVAGPIRTGLTTVMEQHPDVKAVLMGTRRSDPHAANLQAFQVGRCFIQSIPTAGRPRADITVRSVFRDHFLSPPFSRHLLFHYRLDLRCQLDRKWI